MSEERADRKILIVDDEETVGIGISEILKDAGYAARYVTSGKAALDEFAAGGYTLVFMDMVMPGMNGLETYRRMRKTGSRAKVVLFTGYFRDADTVIYQGVREGMIDECIRKPFYAEEILKTARKYA